MGKAKANSKAGKDKAKCERYRKEGNREANKQRRIEKEARRQERLKGRKLKIDERKKLQSQGSQG